MIVLINHALDLDGLGSQAILKKYFDSIGKKIKVFYAIYSNFVDKIQKAISQKPKQIIIADIGFNESFKKIFPLFDMGVNKGIEISWFDHHLVESKIQEQLKKRLKVYMNDPKSCSSKIVYKYFLPKDQTAQKIAEYAYDTDFNEKKFPIAQNLQLVIAYNRGNDKKLENIVDLLSKGRFKDEFINNEIINAQKWMTEQGFKIEENYRSYPIEKGKNFIISFAKFSASKISRILEEKFPNSYFYLGFDERTNEVVIRSNHHNCRDIAKNYGGGGHAERAGFSSNKILIRNGDVNKYQLSINENFIKDFIKKLKF